MTTEFERHLQLLEAGVHPTAAHLSEKERHEFIIEGCITFLKQIDKIGIDNLDADGIGLICVIRAIQKCSKKELKKLRK